MMIPFCSSAVQDWKCIISMLLDENPMIELTDVDATNLVRLFHASTKKAVGERIVPATDNRKQYYTKAQKVWVPSIVNSDHVKALSLFPEILGRKCHL